MYYSLCKIDIIIIKKNTFFSATYILLRIFVNHQEKLYDMIKQNAFSSKQILHNNFLFIAYFKKIAKHKLNHRGT